MSWGKRVALGAALLLVAGLAYVATSLGVAVNRSYAPVDPDVAPEVRAAPVQPGECINVLVMALDQDALRTDVLLLVSFDLEQKRVAAIQIPRDTRAYLAGKGTIEKVNHAYVYGIVDEYGNIDPDEVFPSNLRTLKTVEGLLGVRIHHTVVVDMAAFVRAIDAIGGVEVDIPFKMEYDDPYQDLHIHFEPGPQVLNGQKALEYVRWRHNNDGTGYPDEDLGRIRAQQAFMRTVIAKVTSPGSLVRLPALLQELAGYVESTIEPSRLPALIALVAGLDPGSVEITTLPGTSASLYEVGLDQYLNYYLHDPVATRQLVDRLVHGIDPELAAEVRVEVAAAAGDPRAEAIIGRMAEQGFQVGRTDPPAELPAAVRVEPSGDAAGSLMVARSLLAQGYPAEMVTAGAAKGDAVRVILPAGEEPAGEGRIR